jgi:hypothetical protein
MSGIIRGQLLPGVMACDLEIVAETYRKETQQDLLTD